MRVRTVDDLGADSLYIRTHEMLLVDSSLTEWERGEVIRLACARYETTPERRLRLV